MFLETLRYIFGVYSKKKVKIFFENISPNFQSHKTRKNKIKNKNKTWNHNSLVFFLI
jgi:hypothetical protein